MIKILKCYKLYSNIGCKKSFKQFHKDWKELQKQPLGIKNELSFIIKYSPLCQKKN